MLNKLEQNDLYLKPEKCDFKQKEIDYLGVIDLTNEDGSSDDEEL